MTTSRCSPLALFLAAKLATSIVEARSDEFENIAQYQVVNAVAIPGELTPTLNAVPRPLGCEAGTATESMGTRATHIVFSATHPLCSEVTPSSVSLARGTHTTVAYYPKSMPAGRGLAPAPQAIEIATVTHPFTRGGTSRTLHLLNLTRHDEVPVSISGHALRLARLSTRSLCLQQPGFTLLYLGKRLGGGSFDERDHCVCILYDKADGSIGTILTGATTTQRQDADSPVLEEIAQYQVINAVGLSGSLAVSLNETPRPDPYPAGATMGSMGTRAHAIRFGGHHTACRNAATREVTLRAGSMTTVIFYPAITRSPTTGNVTRADLEIAIVSHPFTRHGGQKTIHLLLATENQQLPVAINGNLLMARRLMPTTVELAEPRFEIEVAGVRLADGQFDARDHLVCIVFDAADGTPRAVLFD
jgi:hypothetical protein